MAAKWRKPNGWQRARLVSQAGELEAAFAARPLPAPAPVGSWWVLPADASREEFDAVADRRALEARWRGENTKTGGT